MWKTKRAEGKSNTTEEAWKFRKPQVHSVMERVDKLPYNQICHTQTQNKHCAYTSLKIYHKSLPNLRRSTWCCVVVAQELGGTSGGGVASDFRQMVVVVEPHRTGGKLRVGGNLGLEIDRARDWADRVATALRRLLWWTIVARRGGRRFWGEKKCQNGVSGKL